MIRIFQEQKRPQEPKNAGLEQRPMNANCTYAAREVIEDVFDFLSSNSFKNGWDPFCYDGYPRERGRVPGGSSTINIRFYSQADQIFFKESGMNWDQQFEFDRNEIITYDKAALIKEEELKKVSWGPNHQAKVPKCTGVVLRNDSKSLGTCVWPSQQEKYSFLIGTDPVFRKDQIYMVIKF